MRQRLGEKAEHRRDLMKVQQKTEAMMGAGTFRNILFISLLLAMSITEAMAQRGGPNLSLEFGPAVPVGRDAGFDFRGAGFGAELTFSHALSGIISLKSGTHLSVAPFDEQFHRRSYHFPLETPDRISAGSSTFLGAFVGTEVTAIRTGGFSFHVGGEAGYGLLVMPPVDYDLEGLAFAVERNSIHGLTLGGNAGVAIRLAEAINLRVEAGTRTMRFAGDYVGEMPVARRGSIQEMTFRIGVARAF